MRSEAMNEEIIKQIQRNTIKKSSHLILTKKEITHYMTPIWHVKPSPCKENAIEHGATYPVQLIIPLIQLYCHNPYEYVLDPFMGSGTTLLACRETQRHCIGFELNPKFYAWNKKILEQQSLDKFTPNKQQLDLQVYNTDCMNLLKYIKLESISLTVTSPPYANFIQQSLQDRKKRTSVYDEQDLSHIKQYSENPLDFGNMDYPVYLQSMKILLQKLLLVTKPGGYVILIIRDHRIPKQNISYLMVHADLARLGEECGFFLHDIIIWDQSLWRIKVFLGSEKKPYTNQYISYMVILRKKD